MARLGHVSMNGVWKVNMSCIFAWRWRSQRTLSVASLIAKEGGDRQHRDGSIPEQQKCVKEKDTRHFGHLIGQVHI